MSVIVPVSVPVKGSGATPTIWKQIATHVERAADHFWIPPEAARPIVVGEHGVGMRARGQVVVFGEQTSQGGPQSERVEHPAGDVLPVGFLDLLVRPVGQIGALGLGDRDQFGLILHCGAHLAELRIFAAIACF